METQNQEQRKRSSFKEVARSLDRDGNSFAILEEDLWGIVRDVYRPLARIELPILYSGMYVDSDKPIYIDIVTEFSESFYEGRFLECNELPSADIDNDPYWKSRRHCKIQTLNGLEAKEEPEEILRTHLYRFFDLYSKAKKEPEKFRRPDLILRAMKEFPGGNG